jgi:hypothetical protein
MVRTTTIDFQPENLHCSAHVFSLLSFSIHILHPKEKESPFVRRKQVVVFEDMVIVL